MALVMFEVELEDAKARSASDKGRGLDKEGFEYIVGALEVL